MPKYTTARDAPDWFDRVLAVTPTDRTITVDGCSIAVASWGSVGEPLVLVHGGGAHNRWWSFIAPFFADTHQVFAVDLSGHGQSDWREAYTVEAWAAEVAAVVEQLADGRPATLVGHSLGSQVAAAAAARSPSLIPHTVLVDMGLRKPAEPSGTAKRFRFQVSYGDRATARERFALVPKQECENQWILDHIAEHSLVERPDGRWGWKFDMGVFGRTSDRWIGDYLAEAPGRLSLVRGAESRVVPPHVAERVLTAVGRPVADIVIPGARHHVWLDQPEAFVAVLRTLLVTADRRLPA